MVGERHGTFLLAGAVRATEEFPVRLPAMADDLAAAMVANRGERLNGAFETVEDVGRARGDYLEREGVLVAANFASGG